MVERTVEECTQQSRDEDSVWTGDELLALAASIADGIRQGLVQINSWSDVEWDGLFNTVLVAIRQIFNDDSDFVSVEDRILKLYSNDYESTSLKPRARPLGKEPNPRRRKKIRGNGKLWHL